MDLLVYFGQVTLYTAVLWAIFRMLWRDRPYLKQARLFLLSSLLLPVVLPFIHLPVPVVKSAAAGTLPFVRMDAMNLTAQTAGYSWSAILLYLYAAIALTQLFVFVASLVRIRRKLGQGRVQEHSEYKLITGCSLGPGTFGRCIFFPAENVDRIILEHERAHIRLRHQADLLLLQAMRIVFWFSPAHWLLAQELKALHEFQADQEARKATDTSNYMNLLLSQALGSRQMLSIAHFFSPQLLKRRIMMLQNQKAKGKRSLLFLTILCCAGFLSTVLIAQTKGKETMIATNAGETSKSYADVPPQNLPPLYGEVNFQGASLMFKTVEQKPLFKGNIFEWLQKNLRTENLNLNEKTPACIVSFVVTASGAIQNPIIRQSSGIREWDAEVMRVIKLMPAWSPGLQKGSPVAVSVELPVFHNGGGC